MDELQKTDDQEKIMAAIQKVQQNAESIKKGAEGQVGQRTYMYANLNDTWNSIKDLLKSNNLVVVQSPVTNNQGTGNYFETTIYHTESGQSIKRVMQMILSRDDPQGIGSAITYYRRYMLTSMLGLIPDDDNDAKEHRLATAEQKARIVGAVKQIFPDVEQPHDIIKSIENIVGKHPSRIREDEVDNVIGLIQSFKAQL